MHSVEIIFWFFEFCSFPRLEINDIINTHCEMRQLQGATAPSRPLKHKGEHPVPYRVVLNAFSAYSIFNLTWFIGT